MKGKPAQRPKPPSAAANVTSSARPARRSRPVLRWTLPVLLALMLGAAWGAFLSEEFMAVVAWWALLTLVPLLGLLAFVLSALYVAWKKHATAPVLATLLLGLFALWPGAWNWDLGRIAFPVTIEHALPAARVRLPSDQRLRVLWGGDQLKTNQHAFFPDQRWAYDLGVEPSLVNSFRLADYGCWGTPVVAPASARVAGMRNDRPDEAPGTLASSTQPFGNFVSLELESKTYLVIAHLQAGSVLVHEGDRVQEGQPIARCGNSGHTSEPHIHIHHQRQPLNPELPNFAQGLPLFFRDQDGAAMPEGGLEVVGEHALARGAQVRHVGKQAATAAPAGDSGI